MFTDSRWHSYQLLVTPIFQKLRQVLTKVQCLKNTSSTVLDVSPTQIPNILSQEIVNRFLRTKGMMSTV